MQSPLNSVYPNEGTDEVSVIQSQTSALRGPSLPQRPGRSIQSAKPSHFHKYKGLLPEPPGGQESQKKAQLLRLQQSLEIKIVNQDSEVLSAAQDPKVEVSKSLAGRQSNWMIYLNVELFLNFVRRVVAQRQTFERKQRKLEEQIVRLQNTWRFRQTRKLIQRLRQERDPKILTLKKFVARFVIRRRIRQKREAANLIISTLLKELWTKKLLRIKFISVVRKVRLLQSCIKIYNKFNRMCLGHITQIWDDYLLLQVFRINSAQRKLEEKDVEIYNVKLNLLAGVEAEGLIRNEKVNKSQLRHQFQLPQIEQYLHDYVQLLSQRRQ